jgi:exodeoxyribonuclease V alpha subunit
MTVAASPDMSALLRAGERGVFSALDIQFATRLGALFEETSLEVLWALALVCRQEAHGHVCADLPGLESRGLDSEIDIEEGSGWVRALPEGVELDPWLASLRASGLVGASTARGSEAEPKPLILDHRGRLYLRRSFADQSTLASEIQRRAHRADLAIDWPLAESGIARLCPGAAQSETDWAKVALRVGLARPLAIVTGGPGTGKTTLVARLIVLLIEQALARGARAPKVRLLAPTGKAAAAMTASFQRQRDALEVSEEVEAALPASAETIHRVLLGQTRRDAFGRAHSTPLEADVVVVDEASMVDLAQMRELFTVCEAVERIALLGDPDQLASVDSGAVLAELCSVVSQSPSDDSTPDFPERSQASGDSPPRLVDSIVTLRESHRFASGGAIGRLAESVRVGDAEAVLSILADPAYPDVELVEFDSVANVRARLAASVRAMQKEIESTDSLEAKLGRIASRRVLCAHRSGPLGVEALCEVLDDAAAESRRTNSRSGWWRGKLLLVTRNAPEQDLWNGDVGLVEETPGGLRALFSNSVGGVRSLSAGRLPAYESAIAMSVHKSQGSEFEVVDLVLGRKSSRLMTRELLYTGVTRARERLCIHASQEAIRQALACRVERDSALAEILMESES